MEDQVFYVIAYYNGVTIRQEHSGSTTVYADRELDSFNTLKEAEAFLKGMKWAIYLMEKEGADITVDDIG